MSVTPPRIDVFIEGSKDPSPAGRARLAAAIAEKFGMPRDKIEQGLAAGRVRAKAGADPEAARVLKAQLEAIGAVVGLVDVAPVAKVDASRPVAATAPAPSRGSPPVARATPIASPPPPAPKPPPPPHTRYESGLSAAFDGRGTGQNAALAALDRIAQAPQDSISLASVDGVDVAAKAPPPAGTVEASAPAAPSAKNLFAPPSDHEAPELELARPTPRTPTSPPRPSLTPSPPRPSLTPSPPLPAPTPTPPPVARGGVSRRVTVPPGPAPEVVQVLDLDRKRWLAGLALAVALGFLVAHLWGSSAEARYDAIRADATATMAPITDDEYALALDRHHLAVTALERAHSRARLTAGLLWLLVGVGVVFAERRFGHLVLRG